MSDVITRLNAALQGRYRVERQLGEGGMAAVYLAEDLKHHRKVALKVLKPEVAAMVGAQRFLTEIETTASLQHPHILPLHDSGIADGFLFYVMPHVEGESLRERLDREHQLPVQEALRIATNVAEALDYAHRRGVIHRDIKPANILLQDGKPVVSDFGIALAVNAGGSGRITETGLSLGTPHYMSPEQATGDMSVGPATDVWALGCVLYEMLLGEPPYAGSTPQAVLGKIMTAEPSSVTASRRSVPTNADAAIRKALEKLPADRFVSAHDFSRALGDPSFQHDAHGGSRPRMRLFPPLAAGVATMVLGAATGASVVWGVLLRIQESQRQPVVMSTISIPEGLVGSGRSFSISPDGRALAYVSTGPDSQSVILVRRLADGETRPLLGTEGGSEPVFSPDSEWIAFVRGDSLLKLRLDSSSPLAVTSRAGALGQPSWEQGGVLFFVSGAPGPAFVSPLDAIYRVPDQGGEAELVATPPRSNESYRWPELLPDGRALLLTVVSASGSEIRLLELATGQMRTIAAAGSQPQYIEETGHIIYIGTDQALYALPFEVRGYQTTGDAVRVVAPMLRFDVSENGIAGYQVGQTSRGSRLVIAEIGGAAVPLPISGSNLMDPRFSPDGRRIAFGRGGQIYVHDVVLGTIRELTNEPGDAYGPLWSEDGSIAFMSTREGALGDDVFRQRLDGNGAPVGPVEQIFALEGNQYPSGWTRDGRLLASEFPGVRRSDLVILSFGGDSVSRTPYLEAGWIESAAVLSPDERWVAYVSDETGQFEVYVRSFPEPGASVRVSEDGGVAPSWSQTGETLFYQQGQNLVAAAVRLDPNFDVLGQQTVLTGIRSVEAMWGRRQYDVHPDGDRFAVLLPITDGSESLPAELQLVVNWFQVLRDQVGN